MFSLSKKKLANIAVRLREGKRVNGWRCMYEGRVFVNKKRALVVKRFGVIVDSRTPKIVRVPTLSLCDGWFAQPLVNTRRVNRAKNVIHQKLQPYYKRIKNLWPDLHNGNVGWYKKKAVMFDW